MLLKPIKIVLMTPNYFGLMRENSVLWTQKTISSIMSNISFNICRILDPKSQESSNLRSKIAPLPPGVSEKKSPVPGVTNSK